MESRAATLTRQTGQGINVGLLSQIVDQDESIPRCTSRECAMICV